MKNADFFRQELEALYKFSKGTTPGNKEHRRLVRNVNRLRQLLLIAESGQSEAQLRRQLGQLGVKIASVHAYYRPLIQASSTAKLRREAARMKNVELKPLHFQQLLIETVLQ